MLAFLSQNELFAGIPEPVLAAITARVKEVRFAAGAIVVKEGDKGESLFLVWSGRLKVVVERPGGEPAVVAHLESGATVGEIAVLTGDRRAATVIAETESRLIEFSRDVFEQLVGLYPAEVARILGRILDYVEKRQLSMALHRNPLFGSLRPDVLQDLIVRLENKFLAGGEILFREGELGDAVYLVVSGRLRIAREENGSPATLLAELGPGDTVGEVAVLGGETRSATAIAIRDTQVARLPREGFQEILEKHALIATPFFVRRLVDIIKTSRPERTPVARARSIAVSGVTSGLDLHRFTAELSGSMGQGQRVLHLTSRVVDEALGPEMSQMMPWNPRSANLLMWLNSKEQEYDCVLYETDAQESPWSERCMRQADHILLVADATAGASRRPWSNSRHDAGEQPVSLVLLHPDGQEPKGTAEWLSHYKVGRHYHLRLGSRTDFDRLARFLTGRAIGVALGGGFARGIAHAGVLRAINELGIPIDAIGGTSMGSLITMQHVYGYTYEMMVELSGSGSIESMRDWTLPLASLFHGKKVRKVISSRTLERNIEDLWLPCFTVATNLTRASCEMLNSGPVDDAILASSRVPGMFPPIVRGEDLLVDGGLMSNVPADLMKPFCGGPVIAVDVSSVLDFKPFRSQHSDISGWKLLFDRMRRVQDWESTPSIITVLMRSMGLDSEAYRERMRAISDLYLTPPVRKYRLTDFMRGAEMAEEAYLYSFPKLEQWWSERKESVM